MNDSKEPRDPLLLDHEADGIRELDNKLPRWWVWLFYMTIAFAAGYLIHFHVLKVGNLSAAEYLQEMERGEKLKQAAMTAFEAELPNLQPSKDPALLAKGKETYGKLCAPCHRQDGGGLVGPNLTDGYWIHGSNFVDNVRTIVNGVPDKGMITWRGLLNPGDIVSVASYVYTLRGAKLELPGKLPENQAPTQAAPNPFE